MAEDGGVGALAVVVKVLRGDGRDGHGDADEAVVVYADPDDVEPRQAALWGAPGPALAAAAGGGPAERPHPRLDGLHQAEVLLLLVQVRGHVVAQQGEEGGYGKGLVAVGDNLEVDGVPVEAQRQERGRGVDGHHEEDADDVFLLARLGVVRRVHEDEVERHDDCDEGGGGGDDEGELVEG